MKLPSFSLLLTLSMAITGAAPCRAQSTPGVLDRNQATGSGTAPGKLASSALASVPRPITRDWNALRAQAEAGDAECAYELGRRYEHGIGVRPNARQALRWYRHSARGHFARAQYSVGRLLAGGEAGRVNCAEAFQWFRRAAAQGHALAQNRLGMMYQRGQGVAPDAVEAFQWFTLAARGQEFGAAPVNLRALAEQLTPSQIAEGKRRAACFVPQTAGL